jgi:signal transduction histidine kinase
MMQEHSILARLSQIPLFAQLTGEQIASIAHGKEIWLQPGEYLVRQGELRTNFYVVLDGSIEWTTQVSQRRVSILIHEPGMYFGHEPILLDIPVPVSGRALTAMHLYTWDVDAFWQLISMHPSMTRELLKSVAQRSQTLDEVSQQQAKLISLGTMAAGLAHELNNPASAGRRAAEHLRETLQSLQSSSLKLQEYVTSAQLIRLTEFMRMTLAQAASLPPLDTLTQSDREDNLTVWLDEHQVADGWKLATTLVRAGLESRQLDTFAEQIEAASLGPVLSWLDATLAVGEMVEEIVQSTGRISELVKAIKEYTYMDQAPQQEVDVHTGLENTLTILNYKLKKGVSVTRDYDQNLPRICAYGSELNQVWTNLIDNSIDAMAGQGQIWIRTARDGEYVRVEITDNGPGIPIDIQSRIFEPFFTTKGVGEGSGLGLDIAYRIVVGRHHGDISVSSKPGNTRFQIRLPMSE